jgi:hypothetical protein
MTLLPILFVLAAGPQLSVLGTDLPVWDIAVSDVDGNGRGDVLALCSDPDKEPLRKQLAVFLAGEAGYPSKPSFAMNLGIDTGVAFLSEVDGKAPAELVVTDATGGQVYSFAGGGFKAGARVDFVSLLPSHVAKPAFMKHLASDMNGDGKDEWVVPTPTGFSIRSAEKELAQVGADVGNSVEVDDQSRVIHRIPAQVPFRLPANTGQGIAFMSDRFVDYVYGENWAQHVRYRIPLDMKDKWVAEARMEDIDGNGLPDLVVTQTQGTVNLRGLTQVYFAKQPFTFATTPDASFEVSGALSSPLLKDVDGDGRTDLLFIKIPIGVKTFLSYFVSQKLSLQIEAYLLKDGAFAATPDLRGGITVDAPENRKRVAYALGDFNGDKRIDLAFGSGAAQLVVYAGAEDRVLSAKPWQTLNVPSVGEARPYKLNEGEAEDLVLFHPSSPEQKRIDVIVF